MGPGSGFGTGQILHMIDIVVNYGLACAAKIQRDRLKSLSIKRDAVLAFMDYSDRYFPQTNFLAGCNAWFVISTSPSFNILSHCRDTGTKEMAEL